MQFVSIELSRRLDSWGNWKKKSTNDTDYSVMCLDHQYGDDDDDDVCDHDDDDDDEQMMLMTSRLTKHLQHYI